RWRDVLRAGPANGSLNLVTETLLHPSHLLEQSNQVSVGTFALFDPKKYANQVFIAGPKAEPTTHLHQSVGCIGDTSIVANSEALNGISAREFVAANYDLPDWCCAEVRGLRRIAVDD